MGRADRGKAAELVAMAFERLRVGPAAAPLVKYVGARKGLGYDVHSCEGGGDPSPRFIEVKSLSADGSFFLTERERANLTALGERAWLYLVDLNQKRIARIIQNPLRALGGPGKPLTYKFKI